MDKINKMFLEALKASLCNQKCDWDFEIQQEECVYLFQLAEIHHVLPMIYDAVYSCPAFRKIDISFLAPFKGKTIQQVTLQTMMTGEFLQLYQYLCKSGIKPVVVKGIICRDLYPNPDYRISSDEDLLIPPESFDLCYQKLIEYGMVVADPNIDIRQAYEVPFGKTGSPVYIELHKHLFPPDSEAYGEFNSFFEGAHEKAIEITVQGIPVYTMEYTSHFFYLICHAFKHFLHSGFGIRQACDIVLFANKYGKDIDWIRVLEQSKAIHAEQFVAALMQIGAKYLIFSPEKACYPDEWKSIDVDEKPLLEDLLSSGIYGDANISRRHSSNITLSAMSAEKKGKQSKGSILRTIFPPLERLKGRYPYLIKYPYLLPIAWMNRIWKYKKEMNKAVNEDAARAIQIGNERVELMKKYGIIK